MTDAHPAAIRNILYLEDMHAPDHPDNPSHIALSTEDIQTVAKAPYSHVLVSFLHFNIDHGELDLYYNDLQAATVDWQQFRDMQKGEHAKKVLVSYGGWIDEMTDWTRIQGKEEQAAEIMADFLERQKLDGFDINFEGPDRASESLLEVLGKFVVHLRLKLGDEKLITIAPMQDNVILQLEAIDAACAGTKYPSWREMISWINCQFYTYPHKETPEQILNHYHDFIGLDSIPADQLVVGLPLWDSPPTENEKQLKSAQSLVAELAADPTVKEHGGFGGVFVWRYKFTRYPANLNWAEKLISVPVYQYEASRIEALRYQYSLFPNFGQPGQGGEGWTNDGISFFAFDQRVKDVPGAVGVYGYYSVYHSGCWRYDYSLVEDELPHWTQVGDAPLFYVFKSEVPGTQAVYRYLADEAATKENESKRYQYSLDPNIARTGWAKDGPAFYASAASPIRKLPSSVA